jgi:hypothetical protein
MLKRTSPRAARHLQLKELKKVMMMSFLLRLRKRRRTKHKLTMRVVLLRPRRSKKLVPAGKIQTLHHFGPIEGL